MRIGISVRGRRSPNFWRDGATQYALFLAAAFMRLPFVRAVALIDVGGECRLPREVGLAAPGLAVVTQQQAPDDIDVLIELAGGLNPEWIDRMRSRGGKVIGSRYATKADDASPAARGRQSGATLTDRCDEIWLLPKDELSIPLMRTRYRCPLRVLPFVWSPLFIERRAAALQGNGAPFGYEAARSARSAHGASGAGSAGWRVAVYEPDLSAMTEPGIPMLACEDVYRKERSAVSALHVLNASRLNVRGKRAQLAGKYDLVRDHRTTFHGTHDLVDFVARHADAVFAHQHEDGDAYGYLDVLYGGYPLIHNSPWLLDAGYYFPGADVHEAAGAFLAALHCHDDTLDSYRARSRSVFDVIDPFGDANLSAYAQALLSVGASRDAG